MGSYMVRILAENGHPVVATDLGSSPPRELPDGVTYIPADLTDRDSLTPVCEGVEIIFNPASIFDFSTPVEVMERVNVGGVENLCSVAVDAGVRRLMHWGTMMIYGDTKKRTQPIDEETPRVSASIYASSKIRQEDIVMRYSHEGKLPATVVRPAIVYGPGSKYGLADIAFKAKHLPMIPILTGLKARTCLVHALDVCLAAYHLSSLDEAIGECYNCCDDHADLPMRDMFTVFATVLEKVPVPLPAPRPVIRFFAQWLANFTSKHDWMRVDGLPIMEQDFIHLLDMDGYSTNAKLRSTGYEFAFPDWRAGLVDTSHWYKERGLW